MWAETAFLLCDLIKIYAAHTVRRFFVIMEPMHYCEYFKNKKITLMGLGVLGRGVGDAEFLAECRADIVVTDLKNEEELSESVERLKKYKNITFALGEHRMEDFKNRDMIIKSAGTPIDSPYIVEARKNNIPIEMSTALFASLSDSYIIGVTGTRGKTTVVYLLYEILKKAGKKVHLGGNVRGVSTLSLLKHIQKGDFVVLELDSWQLQGFGERRISPHMAIFTNFLPDHMNYYDGDMKQYWDDKEQIFKYQKKDDYLIITNEILRHIKKFSSTKDIKSNIVISKEFPDNWKLNLLGEHNRKNCAIAITAARTLSISDDSIQKTIKNFSSVAGRLEFIREIKGLKIYNDTTATTPDATVAALKALGHPDFVNKIEDPRFDKSNRDNLKPKIILIMGGTDKGLDMSKLVKIVPKYCKMLILMPGTGTDMLRFKNKDLRFKNIENLKEAVKMAIGEAKEGDIVLFSPAFTSFGLFKNEFDRGEQFCDIVSKL